MIEAIGRHRIAGREIALYEALLDRNLPLAVRCACLTALEELNFKPIFDVWEDTTILAGFREAGLQIKTLERMLFDLASHIAFIGKESLPPEVLKKFALIVSSIESLCFQHQQMSAKNEAEAGQGEIKTLVDTIECVYDMAMELKGEVMGKMI